MSGDGGMTFSTPNDTTPASLARSGHMRRWAVPSATLGGFTTTGFGTQQRLGVALATASVAGAMTAAAFNKLATLQVPVSRLNYAASTDVLNGVALTANTWTDVHANQGFSVSSVVSLLLVELRLSVNFGNPGSDTSVAARLIFDSAGTNVTAEADGGIGKLNEYAHAGGHFFLAQSFAAGAHTVKAQVIASTAATAYCRASTAPNFEWCKLIIYELNP